VKLASLLPPSGAVALIGAAIFACASIAQAPQTPPPAGPGGPPRSYPAPTNLQVLPKNLTGQQVRDIMEGYEAALGQHCSYCHAADPKNVGPNGRPRLNYASDEKDEKKMARIMIAMTEEINKNYVAKVAAIDEMPEKAPPVTCGTCHQGHEDPPEFKSAPEHGPGAPAGSMPGMQH
jgi:Photosynthetic reaction centre cytochrome C subunit